MHVTTNIVSLATLVIGLFLTLLAVAAVAWVAWRYIGQASYKAQGEVTDRQDKTIAAMRKQMRDLQAMVKMQDKRISRAEIEGQRKERMLYAARQEIDYFEEVIRLVLPLLSQIAPEDKRKADTILKQLSAFRAKAAREQMEWEEAKDALGIYLEHNSDLIDDENEDAAPLA